MDEPMGEWPGPGVISDDIPEELRGWIKAELVPGERLLWAARSVLRPPSTGRGYLIAFGIGVGGLGLGAACLAGYFGVFGPLRMAGFEGVIATVGAIAGVVGALVLFGATVSWFEDGSTRTREARKLFALTDRRAVIWKPQAGSEAVEVLSIYRGEIDRVHRVEYPGGAGDVKFARAAGLSNGPWPPLQFEMVPEVRRIEALARETLVTAPRPEVV